MVCPGGTDDQVESAGKAGLGGPHPGPLPKGEGVDAKVADRVGDNGWGAGTTMLGSVAFRGVASFQGSLPYFVLPGLQPSLGFGIAATPSGL